VFLDLAARLELSNFELHKWLITKIAYVTVGVRFLLLTSSHDVRNFAPQCFFSRSRRAADFIRLLVRATHFTSGLILKYLPSRYSKNNSYDFHLGGGG
jgi:hypothetical protein